MSHSRIFKIQDDLTAPYEEISEDDYQENGFIDGFHDYVAKLSKEETEEAYNWLNSSSSHVWHVNKKSGGYYVSLITSEVELYLEKQWALFRNEYFKPLEERDSWLAKSYLGDISGFYFERPGWGYDTEFETLETIYKYCINSNIVRITFRLEGALDYHS